MRAIALLILLALPAQAQDAARSARIAAADLGRAAETLRVAEGASARLRALTAVVRAQEAGLAALRDGLRQAATREDALSADLAAREVEIGRLVAALQAMEHAPVPLLLLHPSGAVGTARASMTLEGLAPQMEVQAAALRADLDVLRRLRTLETAAADALGGGVVAVQAARAALSEAVAERTDLPAPMGADDAQIAALVSLADTLTAFANGLGGLPPGPDDDLVLPLPAPAAGTVLRSFGDRDAAGISRPGLVLTVAPESQIAAPAAGTIRHAGPLLDYKNVIVLEPRPGTLMVFAGLAEVYHPAGTIVEAGASLGRVGGRLPGPVDFLRQTVTGGGASPPETLYIEVREDGSPVDPAEYFATDQGRSRGEQE
ncbi:Membrane-bound metallopeptidase [Jannaschia seosinensis]|uniref:Membrane-bound metallopeptidase n=1 Tax=Jannaschia seosinensis TaxID=313367 RepID=A0A0M7B518_9RHOB|nr:peptidoglycan DD-metalloendopeptidase family protein [Jannaschia seosinensis]CUH23125.1 Membrane-bound metallopeptidase [Jannaschia seosinensis]